MFSDAEKGKKELPGFGHDLEDVDSYTSESADSTDIRTNPQICSITRVSTRCSEKNPGSIHRTLTAISRVSTAIPLTPPPDGGTKAYLQIAGAVIGMGMPWGMINTWGACQTYYTTTLLPDYDQSTISWIGSLQVTLIFLCGIFSGRAADAGYYYPLTVVGWTLQIIAIFMTSLATEYWQLILAQGLCFGIGAGIAFTPVATLVSTYFEKKRALALSIGAMGTSIFGMVFPVIIEKMAPTVGFPWAMRTIGFLLIFFYMIAGSLLRWRLPPRRTGPLLDYSALSDWPYIFGVLGHFFAFWSLYYGFFYIGVFASTIVGLPESESINLLLAMVGVGIPARIFTGLLSDRKTGPLNIVAIMFTCAGTMLLAWIAVDSVSSLYAFSVLYGFSAAGAQGLFPALISSLSSDITVRGTRIGMAFFVTSFAVLSGPPIAGALIAKDNGGFLYSQIWGGLSMLLGVGFLIIARIKKTGFVLRVKA